MEIDLKIKYEDLSEDTKQKIKKLEDDGYKVNLVYPDTEIMKYPKLTPGYPDWTQAPSWSYPPYWTSPCTNTSEETPKPSFTVYCKTGNQEAKQ